MLKAIGFPKSYLDIDKWSRLTPYEKKTIIAWYNKNKGKPGWYGDKPGHVRAGKKGAKTRKENEHKAKIDKMDAVPTPTRRHAEQNYEEENSNQERDRIDAIAETTKKYRPIKYVFQFLFPNLAPLMEGFYLVLTNLNKIRDLYNFTNSPSEQLNNPLNETIGDVVGKITKTAIPLVDSNILEITDKSIEYLEEKNVFKDLTEVVGLEKHYSNSFKEFYSTSLKNSLNQEVKGNIKS